MERTRNYYPTKAQSFTAEQWLIVLKETDCFTPVLLEAVCALVFEMGGKGSASQISAITGRPRQSYNSAPYYTVKRLRKRGFSIPADYRRSSGKERYWSHFFLGYYEEDLFVWEVRETLSEAVKIHFEKFKVDKIEQAHSDEERSLEKAAMEGMQRQRIHFQIERNAAIVRAAKKKFLKKHGAFFCEACGFSFEDTYGIDYIEAHHILPLYKGERTTQEMDLMMLCANCHCAVHSEKWNDKPIEFFENHMRASRQCGFSASREPARKKCNNSYRE